jgi:WD40 repeat protein
MILCGGGLFTWLGTRSGGGGMPATQTPTLPDDPKPMQKQAGFERHIKTEGKATAVQISPDGRYVAAAVEPVGRPKRLMGYRLLDESQTVTTLDEELIFAFDFSPDGQRLVAEVRDKSISRSDIRELSAENGTWMYLLKKPGESPAWLGYTPDGRYVLGVAEKLYRWPVDSPAANPTTVNDKEGNPLAVTYKTRVVFDPSKRYAAVVRGSVGKTVLYRLPDLTFHTELGEGGDEHCVFTTKGDRVVTWNGSRAVVWNTQTGTSEVEHITTCGEPVQLLLTADDRRLVTVGKIDTQVWELLDKGQPGLTIGTPRVTPGRPSGLTEIARAALNPSGRALATVSPSGKIRVRDMTSVNRPGNELTGHRGRIQDIRFTPDGKKLVAAGDEGIFVWSTSDPDRW